MKHKPNKTSYKKHQIVKRTLYYFLIILAVVSFLYIIKSYIYQSNVNCAKEGEIINTWSGGRNDRCCRGLKQKFFYEERYQDNKVDFILQTDIAVCTKCGDGICGIGENIRNCEKDCADKL